MLRELARRREHTAPLPGRLLQGVDRAVLADAAAFHRLSAALYLALRDDTSLPDDLRATLLEDYRDGVARHLRALSTLGVAAAALRAADVRWLVFKGPALAAGCYPRPDLRRYLDLDLLVRPRDLGTSVHALERAGFRVLDRNWVFIDEHLIGELHLMSPDGVHVDLHHDLVFSQTRRSRFRVSATEALDRAVDVELGGRSFPTFSPEDAILHLVLHSALNGADRLGWLVDIDQTVQRRPPDWPTLVARASEWGLAPPAHVVLHRCAVAVGTPVPRDALRALAPRVFWRWMVQASQRPVGVDRSTGGATWTRTLARAAASDVGTSVRLLRNAVSRTLSRRSAPRPRLEEATSLYFNAGGTQRREAFFARLAGDDPADVEA